MKLSEALSAFRQHQASQEITSQGPDQRALDASLELLARQHPNLELENLTPALVRDFVARWYVEEASRRRFSSPDLPTDAVSDHPFFPAPNAFLESLRAFFCWVARVADPTNNQQSLLILDPLAETLPRAIDISIALAEESAGRGGAFTFPEFLTSFAEGGQSEYDIGEKTGQVGAREGYFRILEIKDQEIGAEEILQEEFFSPILVPAKIARLLVKGYILNLEIVRTPAAWQIVNSGFAYPPDTEF